MKKLVSLLLAAILLLTVVACSGGSGSSGSSKKMSREDYARAFLGTWEVDLIEAGRYLPYNGQKSLICRYTFNADGYLIQEYEGNYASLYPWEDLNYGYGGGKWRLEDRELMPLLVVTYSGFNETHQYEFAFNRDNSEMTIYGYHYETGERGSLVWKKTGN